MQIKLAKHLGFCFGVKRAVNIARNQLARQNGKAYCLGPLIHNPQVVSELSRNGLKVIRNLNGISGGVLLIRSHGASPKIIERARKRKMDILDATCPFVKRLHTIADSLQKKGYKILIAADKGHPEIEALSGVVRGLVVASSSRQLKGIKLKNEQVALLAQTTQSPANYKSILSKVAKARPARLRAFNTICRDSASRQQEASKLAKMVDAMIVLGGRDSANTKRLASLCKKACKKTYHIETSSELDKKWFSKTASTGITSGASTPNWVIEEVIKKLQTKGEIK